MTTPERRQHTRYPMELPVTLLLGKMRVKIPGTLLDLSRGGCFLATVAEVQVDSVATMTFVVRPAKECAVRGRVIRLQTGKGFGIKFEAANEAFKDFVRDLASLRPELRPEFLANVLDPEMRIT